MGLDIRDEDETVGNRELKIVKIVGGRRGVGGKGLDIARQDRGKSRRERFGKARADRPVCGWSTMLIRIQCCTETNLVRGSTVFSVWVFSTAIGMESDPVVLCCIQYSQLCLDIIGVN